MTPERLAEIRQAYELWDSAGTANGGDYVADMVPELLGYVDALTAERDMLKRGGRTLGEIVDRQCRYVIEATGSQDIIGEDGDGDWEIVWERLHLMRAALADMTRQRDDARALAVKSGIFQDHFAEVYPQAHGEQPDVGPVAWDRQVQQR